MKSSSKIIKEAIKEILKWSIDNEREKILYHLAEINIMDIAGIPKRLPTTGTGRNIPQQPYPTKIIPHKNPPRSPYLTNPLPVPDKNKVSKLPRPQKNQIINTKTVSQKYVDLISKIDKNLDKLNKTSPNVNQYQKNNIKNSLLSQKNKITDLFSNSIKKLPDNPYKKDYTLMNSYKNIQDEIRKYNNISNSIKSLRATYNK